MRATTVGRRRPRSRVLKPVTSYDLIDRAVAAGAITAGTGVLYKVYRDFGDRRLPARFRGNDAGVGEPSSLERAAAVWGTLSAGVRAALAPFFVLPIYKQSWFFDQQTQARPDVQAALRARRPRPGRLQSGEQDVLGLGSGRQRQGQGLVPEALRSDRADQRRRRSPASSTTRSGPS